jgi:hypothetical protein
MKVYHGTNVRFETIDLAKCNQHNDFGKGFYVTSVKFHAEQRAQNIADRFSGEPIVMEFDFDETYLTDKNYRTLLFEKPSPAWVEFVMRNRDRTNTAPVQTYDMVAGPIADDKMRRQFDRYEAKDITMSELLEKVAYIEPTHQIMLGTQAAIALIQPETAANVLSKIEDKITALSIALVRERNLDMLEAMNIVYNSEVFLKLNDSNTELYLKSWQEIYELLKQELNL